MPTLNQSLHRTSHCSLLQRKAARYGLQNVNDLIELAAMRGCGHFAGLRSGLQVNDPGRDVLDDNQLTILLLHGNNDYEPMAVRCAAQLLKSPFILPMVVANLAVRERVEPQLRYIAESGVKNDTADRERWQRILKALPTKSETKVPECVLPHQSRFMVNPGILRGRVVAPYWLSPNEGK